MHIIYRCVLKNQLVALTASVHFFDQILIFDNVVSLGVCNIHLSMTL